ncbi:glycosyltransferase [Wohlfahrtiimonas larvae]|uniref:Glycosyltransferase 2-like domain-containing protein n=1 Tax=Wohlfahrtiimonas larvae TaxID=1157986 RepID=A0ABP9MTM1_9GAMM|nr:glycosyltransferase [Wohlfahrtiimonas larvae]
MKIAVLIPCLNEEQTVAKVVQDFKKELPDADIYVYDNNSTDKTYQLAQDAGAIVHLCEERGKGNVLRQMFLDITADCYLIVDGDDTYPAQDCMYLIEPVMNQECDMSVGNRFIDGSYDKENTRKFHGFGNRLVKFMINQIYSTQVDDVMSGYRVLSKDFVGNLKLTSNYFQVETEITMYALHHKFLIKEVAVNYRNRPVKSQSKLNTFRDGFKILSFIFMYFIKAKKRF